MEWVVSVSASETACGKLGPDTGSKAHAALREHGCVVLRGAFPRDTIDAMHRDYVSQFGTLDAAAMQDQAMKPPPSRFFPVGDARYEITLRMSGTFGQPAVFANSLLVDFLGTLLGHDMHLSGFTCVVSHPGSNQQHAHRDYPHLFPDIGPTLPVHAINVAVPLIDVDAQTGPTGVWPGSHRLTAEQSMQSTGPTVCELQRGDCMLLDYRTLHAGLPNRGERVRPIVYMVYSRPWFFDHVNHVGRISLDMPLKHYRELPDSLRPLLIRAFSYAVLTRWREVDAGGSAVARPTGN